MKLVVRFKLFLARHRHFFALLSCVLLSVGLAGCGPLTWLSDATQILPIAGSMLAGVLALIGALSGSKVEEKVAAVVSEVIGKALTGIHDLQAIIAEYKQNPSPTLLASIEAGTQAVIDHIQKLLTDTGIADKPTQTKVVQILTLFLNEVKAFATLLPALKVTAGQLLTVTVPMSSKEAKFAFNQIITTPTGDPAVDAALEHLHKL